MANIRFNYQEFENSVVLPEFQACTGITRPQLPGGTVEAKAQPKLKKTKTKPKKIAPAAVINLLYCHTQRLAGYYQEEGKSNPLAIYLWALEIISREMQIFEEVGNYWDLRKGKTPAAKQFNHETNRAMGIINLDLDLDLAVSIPSVQSRAERDFFKLIKCYKDLVLLPSYDTTIVKYALKWYRNTIDAYRQKLDGVLQKRIDEFENDMKQVLPRLATQGSKAAESKAAESKAAEATPPKPGQALSAVQCSNISIGLALVQNTEGQLSTLERALKQAEIQATQKQSEPVQQPPQHSMPASGEAHSSTVDLLPKIILNSTRLTA